MSARRHRRARRRRPRIRSVRFIPTPNATPATMLAAIGKVAAECACPLYVNRDRPLVVRVHAHGCARLEELKRQGAR